MNKFKKKILDQISIPKNEKKCHSGLHADVPANRDEDGSCILCRLAAVNVVRRR